MYQKGHRSCFSSWVARSRSCQKNGYRRPCRQAVKIFEEVRGEHNLRQESIASCLELHVRL